MGNAKLKRIVSHNLGNCVRTISEWSELSMGFGKGFFLQMQPNFVDHLKLVWHTMLIMSLLVLGIIGLGGPNPCSKLVAPNKSLHYSPFQHQSSGARTEVSLEEVRGDAGTKFPHPEIIVMSFWQPIFAFMQASMLLYHIAVTSFN